MKAWLPSDLQEGIESGYERQEKPEPDPTLENIRIRISNHYSDTKFVTF